MLEEVITRVSEQLKAVKAGAAPRGDVGALAGRLEDVVRKRKRKLPVVPFVLLHGSRIVHRRLASAACVCGG